MRDDKKEELYHKLIKKEKEKRNLIWGDKDEKYIQKIVQEWIDDDENYDGTVKFLERRINLKDKLILDFGAGYGTALLYCLKKGYKAVGIDISKDSANFFRERVKKLKYEKLWLSRYVLSEGENLPFKPESFDVVISNQVIEHVNDPKKCVMEIFRVLKDGGILYLRAPDYSLSFYEPHYRIFWTPIFNGRTKLSLMLTKIYLKIQNKPSAGLKYLNFITKNELIRTLKDAGFSQMIDLNKEIIFADRERKIKELLKRFGVKKENGLTEKFIKVLNQLYEIIRQIRMIGKEENQIHVLAIK